MDDEPSPPTNTYRAADWLRSRHPWLDELATRVCGPADSNPGWLDELVEAFNDIATTNRAWAVYEGRHPEPRDDTAWEQWRAQGPQYATDAARALAPMSSGEIRLLRLMTTLSSNRCEQGWHIDDLSFDGRGWAVVQDWTVVVAALADDAQARIQDFHSRSRQRHHPHTIKSPDRPGAHGAQHPEQPAAGPDR